MIRQHRLLFGLALAVIGLTACKIERTPQEYFDHGIRSEEDVAAVAAELRDRVLATAQAISRGSITEAMLALAPSERVSVVVPGVPAEVRGREAVEAALRRFASEGRALIIERVSVSVSPGGSVAWFVARGDIDRGSGAAPDQREPLMLTGTYILYEGDWQLVQAHLARP